MIPFSFDPITAREIIGDPLSRQIETQARQDADNAVVRLPQLTGTTYYDQVQSYMQAVIYQEQHSRRIARNERKKYVESHNACATGENR